MLSLQTRGQRQGPQQRECYLSFYQSYENITTIVSVLLGIYKASTPIFSAKLFRSFTTTSINGIPEILRSFSN